MGARLGYAVMAILLVVYTAFLGHRGIFLLQQGTPVTVGLGAAVLVLPGLALWFLWHSTRFARRAGLLARQLEAEGGLPVDDLPRTPSGRIEKAAADASFERYRAETEANPGEWRTWFRLAVAYHDARDTPRARRAMQHAIALHAGERAGTASGPAGAASADG
ncbi:hypothetical protein [Streptomyces sp. ST2-7A]|uniref:hypothetical protein n=1 Tax=Streptomyces sp. ST2-7A TaxID=2907214 RepID=UPI001F21309B|nr:hypothetical protein [Streptomyces sp. ST2-7A]MCE7080033.1 hypothetical protein [Streptomyces sp. ST2-7A]